MSLLGRLLYDSTVGEDKVFYYVTMSANLLSTDILSLLELCLGSLPSVFGLLSGLFTDALEGIAEGIFDAARASDVLDNVPEFLMNGLQVPTIAYMQGGTPQYYNVSRDLYLKDVEIKPVTLGLLATDIDSLEFYGVRACKCLYAEELKPSDSELPENILVQDSISGLYTVYRPPYGDYNTNTASEGANLQIAQYNFTQNSSSCLCAAVGGLWGEEPAPYNKGHYLNPFDVIQFNPGGVLNGVVFPPFLSSWGVQFSVPFTTLSPTAGTLTALKWQKGSFYGGYKIDRNYRSQPYRVPVAEVNGRVGKRPKKDFIIKEFVRKKTSSEVVVSAAIVALLWLRNRQQC